jgi:hypothetical protein
MRPVVRAVIIGVTTMALYGGAELVHFEAFCAKHLAWLRVQQNASAVVRADGFAVARPGDALFTCVTDHCFGVACHVDLGCYCAAATITPTELARLTDARSCAVDHLTPSFADTTGACRFGHCDDHIGW